jgi:peroxiredoxin family protein
MEQKKLAIIATKGSLDWAYPPFYPCLHGGGTGL